MGADDPHAAEVLWNVSQQYLNGEQYDKCITATQQLLDERFRSWSMVQNGQVIERIANCYLKLKKPANAIALYRKQESDDPSPTARSKWCLRAAQAAQQAGDQQAARDAYRRLLIDHAGDGTTDGWWDAQASYIDGLIAANQLNDALKHCHILLDASADSNQLTIAVQKTADLLQKVDGNKKRLKDFTNSQLYGLAGKDGKPGTSDDLKDVLKEIGYPADAEREAAFAKAFGSIGDDAAAAFHRGQLCIYSGHPAEALAFYADATRRCGLTDWANYANALVMNGLRATRGPGGLDEAVRFLLSGEGENPFNDVPAVGSTPWPAPQLSAADKANVTAVMAGLQQIAADPSIGGEARAAALRGYGRAAETLGTMPPVDPFLGIVGEEAPAVREQATTLVFRLTRGGELHVGKIKAFLTTDPFPEAVQKRTDVAFQGAIKPLMKLQLKNATTPRVPPVKD
jgi:tetratricopeptide (TPR) repeat protein